MPIPQSRRYSIRQIEEIKHRKLFFDTNVLLFIYGNARSHHPHAGNYGKLLAKILVYRMNSHVNEIVLSEFYYASLKHEREASNFQFVKDFRNSEAGILSRETIFSRIADILKRFTFVPYNLMPDDIVALLKIDSLDFNDKLIVETCRKNNFVLVTDDADFKDAPVDILSVNHALIDENR